MIIFISSCFNFINPALFSLNRFYSDISSRPVGSFKTCQGMQFDTLILIIFLVLQAERVNWAEVASQPTQLLAAAYCAQVYTAKVMCSNKAISFI
jgi:hypothetical protein